MTQRHEQPVADGQLDSPCRIFDPAVPEQPVSFRVSDASRRELDAFGRRRRDIEQRVRTGQIGSAERDQHRAACGRVSQTASELRAEYAEEGTQPFDSVLGEGDVERRRFLRADEFREWETRRAGNPAGALVASWRAGTVCRRAAGRVCGAAVAAVCGVRCGCDARGDRAARAGTFARAGDASGGPAADRCGRGAGVSPRRRAHSACRLPPWRWLDDRQSRLPRPDVPEARGRLRRSGARDRLPARARAPVAGIGRRHRRRIGLGGLGAGGARGAPSAVAVAGDSAGGTLAALACLRLRDEYPAALPRLQVLLYANTDLTGAQPSMREKAAGWGLDADAVRFFNSQWVPDQTRWADPRVSPLHAPDLSGLPSALIITAEHDPLRDESEAYARRLRDAGVGVELRREPGLIHNFMLLDEISPACAAAADRVAADLRARLNAP